MNRNYWTIYDDSRKFQRKLIDTYAVDVDFDHTLTKVLKIVSMGQGTLDHFDKESDLFEV